MRVHVLKTVLRRGESYSPGEEIDLTIEEYDNLRREACVETIGERVARERANLASAKARAEAEAQAIESERAARADAKAEAELARESAEAIERPEPPKSRGRRAASVDTAA